MCVLKLWKQYYNGFSNTNTFECKGGVHIHFDRRNTLCITEVI